MAPTQAQHAEARMLDERLLLMHQVMLGDRVRLQGYDRALQGTVRPGDVVIDVGAGTLALSMLALRHGASHVYAIEADPQVAAVAQQIAAHNQLGSRLTLVQGDARSVQLPEKADVLVCEMIGNLGPEEEMAEVVAAVAKRNLRRGGRLVPQRVATRLQAVEFQDEGWGVWRDEFWGFSLAAVQQIAPPTPQLHFFSRQPALLSHPADVTDHRLGEAAAPPTSRRLQIKAPGNLQAIVGYFTATLAPGVTLSNFPSYPGCNWAVWVWPLRHTPVEAGDTIQVGLDCPPRSRLATEWRLDCRIARGVGSH